MTETLGLRVHGHERALRRTHHYARHSEGAIGDRRIPPLVPPEEQHRTSLPLRRGSPLREDDGEGMPLPRPRLGVCASVGGFHGLRPLNDGDLGSPRPLLRTRLAPHSPLRTSFRGSEAITPVSAANPAKRIASEKEEQGSGVERTLRRRTPPNPVVIQSLRQQAKNPPNGSSTLMTRTPQTLLSFSRSARESPKWFLQGNDNVLPRPSAGDPRFARMTEEGVTITRPRLGVCASMGDSTACGL